MIPFNDSKNIRRLLTVVIGGFVIGTIIMIVSLKYTRNISDGNNSAPDTVALTFDKDLVPEGIAIDAQSGKFFINSLKKNKIVTAQLDGSSPTTFIEADQHGYLAGFGMIIKGDTLYALSNSLIKKDNASVLLLLNIKTNQLIDKYATSIPPYAYLNDLAISTRNEIFITDSESNKVYRIQRPHKELEVYLDSEEVPHSNGIAISDDNAKLYLASKKGIRVIDIQTKQILNQPNMESARIDGMKFYKNSLIGMMESGVFRFFLNENGTEIERKEPVIVFDKSYRSPTTFAILDNSIYFIKNTQLDNFNDSTNQMIDEHTLESLLLLKKQLD